jgi:hypothetical protein
VNRNFKIELIGIDDNANQAITLANPSNFDSIKKSSVIRLNKDIDKEFYCVIISTKLDNYILDNLTSHVSPEQRPILVIPKNVAGEDDLERLYKSGFSVIFFNIDNLISISLVNTISLIESILYHDRDDYTLTPTGDDIYYYFSPQKTHDIKVAHAKSIKHASFKLLNNTELKDDFLSLLIVYEIPSDFDTYEVSNSIDILQKHYAPKNSPIFFIKIDKSREDVKTTLLVSKKFDFIAHILSQLEAESDYIPKAYHLLNSYRNDMIDDDELRLLCDKSGISLDDILILNKFIFDNQSSLYELLKNLQDESITLDIKMDLLVDTMRNSLIDDKILMQIASIFSMPIDILVELLSLRENGKLNLQEMKVSDKIQEQFPDIFFGVNGLDNILVLSSEIQVTSNGLLSIEMDKLSMHKNGNEVWIVSKGIDQDSVDEIIDLINQMKNAPDDSNKKRGFFNFKL